MSDRTEWTSQRHWTQNTERRQTKQKHIRENKKNKKTEAEPMCSRRVNSFCFW